MSSREAEEEPEDVFRTPPRLRYRSSADDVMDDGEGCLPELPNLALISPDGSISSSSFSSWGSSPLPVSPATPTSQASLDTPSSALAPDSPKKVFVENVDDKQPLPFTPRLDDVVAFEGDPKEGEEKSLPPEDLEAATSLHQQAPDDSVSASPWMCVIDLDSVCWGSGDSSSSNTAPSTDWSLQLLPGEMQTAYHKGLLPYVSELFDAAGPRKWSGHLPLAEDAANNYEGEDRFRRRRRRRRPPRTSSQCDLPPPLNRGVSPLAPEGPMSVNIEEEESVEVVWVCLISFIRSFRLFVRFVYSFVSFVRVASSCRMNGVV